MSSWSEERRRNLAAEAEQRRLDKDADAERRRKERAAEDQRRRDIRAADREERRREKRQDRRDRAELRRERTTKWTKNTTPIHVYRRGTLALVTASALASLPAQIIHFVSISWILLPIGPALEGAAWVMAAGVAYADERKLSSWVRWLLRGLSMGAAGFAGSINYQYGTSLAGPGGLSAGQAAVVGWGLAAVTMLGPLFFEVRQWVTTLSSDPAERKKRSEEKARAKHTRRRRKHHGDVVEVADKLVSAAPYGTLSEEDAFIAAWKIVHGTDTPGMTPSFHARAVAARAALAAALDAKVPSADEIRARLLEGFTSPHPHARPVLETAGSVTSVPPRKSSGSSQVENQMPPTAKKPGRRGPKTPQKPPRRKPGDTPRYTLGARIQMSETAALAASPQHRITSVNGHHH